MFYKKSFLKKSYEAYTPRIVVYVLRTDHKMPKSKTKPTVKDPQVVNLSTKSYVTPSLSFPSSVARSRGTIALIIQTTIGERLHPHSLLRRIFLLTIDTAKLV